MKKTGFMLCVLLLLLLALLAGCSVEQPGGSGTEAPSGGAAQESAETPRETEAETADPLQIVFALTDGKNTSYQIVNGSNTTDENLAVRTFAQELSQKTGATFSVVGPGSAPSEYEIVFGNVKSRTESREYYSTLSYTEYGVQVTGKKIIMGYYSQKDLEACIKVINQELKKSTDGNTWGFRKDITYRNNRSELVVPVVESDGTLQGVYSSGEGAYQASYTGATPQEYLAHRTKLEQNGYTLWQENTLGGNSFATYLKDGIQIHLVNYPSKRLLKMTYGKAKDLPDTEKGSVAALVTPSIAQPDRVAAELSSPNGAPGMSYVMQLSDGRYIIVDGGPYHAADEKALYDYLVNNNPNKSAGAKPVIAMWFITHAHGDHIDLANNFLVDYKEQVELQAVAYNFPNFNANSIGKESAAPYINATSKLRTYVRQHYPSAETVILRSGQYFYVGDAKVEVIMTHEDYYPGVLASGNHTSSSFRITLGNKSTMFLGDSEVPLCQFMADVYGTALKSDILQVSHHGFNGAVKDLYVAVDPDICLWAVEEARFNSDPRCLGTDPSYDFNKWLRDDSIKQREHYHCSVMTVIRLG